jgi:hypothetical protein
MDVLPAHAISRHGTRRRLGYAAPGREQRGDDVIGVGRLQEVVDGAKFHRLDGGSDIALASQNDRARVGSLLFEERNNVQAAAVMQSQVDHSIFWRAQLNLAESIGNRRGGYHRKALGFHRARQGLHHRIIVFDNHQ